MTNVRSFRELVVWQRAMDMVEQVYRLTQKLPADECPELASQIERTAAAIAGNIAAGHARGHSRQFLHHASVALGSLAELETYVGVAERLKYVTPNETGETYLLMDEVGRMLRGLLKSLRRRSGGDGRGRGGPSGGGGGRGPGRYSPEDGGEPFEEHEENLPPEDDAPEQEP